MRRPSVVQRALALAVLAAVLAPGRGAAQPGSNSTAAQALFDEARALMAQGNTAEACPKLEESQRLDPGSGTSLNLALCYEQAGRLASAWNQYLEAASAAKLAAHSERESEARRRADALRPRLSTIVIQVSKEARDVPGLAVTRDGVAVGAAQWGLAVPADPGDHAISATAPGRTAFHVITAVEGEATSTTITVPALAPAASSDAAPSEGGGIGTQRTLALVLGGVGVVGLGVGTVFGLRSKSKHDEAEEYCDGPACSDPRGVSAGNDARAAGNVATLGVVAGALSLAGGVTLWFTAPRSGGGAETQLGFGLGRAQIRGVW